MTEVPLIDFPLRGAWKAIRSPGHHRHAYDFAALRGPSDGPFAVPMATLLYGRRPVSISYSWAQPVFSPVEGVVVAARDGWPDEEGLNLVANVVKVLLAGLFQARKLREDLRHFAGNHVIIESAFGHVLLAHLQHGSIEVDAGQRVASGQPIGRVGHSGNSAAPHLHLQLNAGPDPLTAPILAFGFADVERWTADGWVKVGAVAPEKGWVLQSSRG